MSTIMPPHHQLPAAATDAPTAAAVHTTIAVADDAAAPSSQEEVPLSELGERICGLASTIASATYRYLVMVAEFDRREGWAGIGIRSCAHWLAWTCSLAPGTAREHVRVARALTTLPEVSAEMAAGRLSYAKVRELTRIADRVGERRLVELARTATASQLARAVRAFRRCDRDRLVQEERRTLSVFTDEDGSVVVSARLPAEEGAAVVAALEAARDEIHRAEPDEPPASSADALLYWAHSFLSTTREDRSGEDRTTVVVHVAAEHLTAGIDDHPSERSRGNALPPPASADAVPPGACQIPSVGGIAPRTAMRLTCNADLIGVIRDADGATIAHGKRRRVVSAAQRRALMIRDGSCRFPSCHRRTRLEAHHVQHWSRGGATDLDNLLLLCRFHHMACHEGNITISMAAASSTRHGPRFITADGIELLPRWDPDAHPGWKRDDHLLRTHLTADNVRPLWAGERFSLADTVTVLFDSLRPAV